MIKEELRKFEENMGELRSNKEEYQNMYFGKVGYKDFPHKNCSNLPAATAVIASFVDGYHDRMMSSLFDSGYVWLCRAVPGGDTEKAEEVQDWLQYLQSVEIKLRQVMDKPMYDVWKYGDMVAYVEWNCEIQRVRD